MMTMPFQDFDPERELAAFDKELDGVTRADGWWHPHSRAAFLKLAEQLIYQHQFTSVDAVEFLSSAYRAVAREFTN